VDPDASSVTRAFPDESMNTAVERLMSAKEEVLNLIVRTIGEVWFAPMMLKLRKLIMQHKKKAHLERIGKRWVQVDPRTWQDRASTSITVGLGTGDRMKKIKALTETSKAQWLAYNAGLGGFMVTQSQMRHTLAEFVRASGLGDPDDYWLEPMKTEIEIMQARKGGQAPSREALEASIERERAKQKAQAQAQANQTGSGQTQPMDPQLAMALEKMKTDSKERIEMAKLHQSVKADQAEFMLGRMKLMLEKEQFTAEERREWANLAAKTRESLASLVLEARKAQSQEISNGL